MDFYEGAGALTAAFLMLVFLFFAPLIGIVIGAFSGWLAGIFFEPTIRTTLDAFGVDTSGLALWQVGATLGFVGSFFRAHFNASNA